MAADFRHLGTAHQMDTELSGLRSVSLETSFLAVMVLDAEL